MNKSGETILRLRSENARYLEALGYIRNVLGSGSCRANKCQGCSYEMTEAAGAARDALKASGKIKEGAKKHPQRKAR